LKDLINLKKKGYKIEPNWQNLSSRSIFFLNTNDKTNFIKYQKKAIGKNCKFIICKKKFKIQSRFKNLQYFYFEDNKKLFYIAKLFFKPLKLKTIFITGTNGKTSVAYGSHQLMSLNKINTCYIGTLGFYLNGKKIKDLKNTTPSFFELLILLSIAENSSADYAFIETSSIGFCDGRLGFLKYDIGFLTNLKSDHLDYHKSLKNYHDAKLNLLREHSHKKSKILIQDIFLLKKLKKIQNDVLSQDNFVNESKLEINQINSRNHEIKSKFGSYKVSTLNYYVMKNIISMIFIYVSLLKKWPNKITKRIFAKGRSEIVYENDKCIILVDYAHSSDAFINLLTSFYNHYDNKIIVYGCGGNRDKTKRPKIAKAVSKYTNIQIITDDNPRDENPKLIRDTLFDYSTNPINIAGREKAIKYAVKLVKKIGGILIVAGKGHENTQTIKSKSYKFSDHLIIKKYAKNFQ
tara:strand:+ start:1184 stop:2569 length:1386 start_codon:yes stop_codon:yes gene_type:complete